MGDTVHVDVEDDGPVRWLMLDRPERLNAFDMSMVLRLIDEVRTAAVDDGVRVLVIGGRGSAFSAGGDLHYVNELRQADDSVGLAEYGNRVQELLVEIELAPKPVVAAVNGAAYAGGLILALVCDLIVASEDARFCAVQARRGLVDPYTASRLAARIGIERAKYLLFTSAVVTGAEAHAMGLASTLTPSDGLRPEVSRLAGDLSAMSGHALSVFKSMMGRLLPPFEVRTYREHMATEDAKAGVAAFVGST